ncbi:MAG: adenylate/guanylate cyclase domain-containing protein, partial [Hyphomicrobiales bacterium]
NPDRALATILFTDIVGSTDLIEKLGDGVWRGLIDRHDAISQESVTLYRGRIVKNTGDGILATFDGPGRAVECAKLVLAKMGEVGIGLRAGLHTGEIELREDDIGGVNVNLAARIMNQAERGQIMVSRTVADLMVGNPDVSFNSIGQKRLKGFSSKLELLFAV